MTQINMVEGSGLGNSNVYYLGLWYSEHISYKTEHVETTCLLAMERKCGDFVGFVYTYGLFVSLKKDHKSVLLVWNGALLKQNTS